MTHPSIGDIPLSELDDHLEHYGVKGMKWGVRKAEGSGGGGSTKKKAPSTQEIKKARRTMRNAMEDELEGASLKKKASIAFLGEASGQLSRDYRMMPERAVALRSTAGERLAMTILAGPSGGASIVALAANTGMRKQIEREQKLVRGD